MKPQIFRKIIYSLSILTIALFINPPKKTYAADCQSSNLRWASSSNTIYLSGPVSCTLSQIKSFVAKAPLQQIDVANHAWFLGANLKIESGAKLVLRGSSIGGDVDELRLKSNNSSLSNSVVNITAQWGAIEVTNSKITSWDSVLNGPDLEYSTYKRAYIKVRSYLEPDWITTRESRLDIIKSDIGYLGYNGSEAYGLSWKVTGSSIGLYDKVNVYGNIIDSRIHHNYFGIYTFGADNMIWQNNEIDHNIKYGLDTHDDSDNLLIEGNNSHDNGNHGIICSQRCDHLIIRGNNSSNNIGHGIMLHRNTNDSIVENNITTNNSDSGIAIFDSHNNTVRNNTATNNLNGIRFSVGSSNNLIENNDLNSNLSYGVYFYKGTDLPSINNGRPTLNHFINNQILNNGSYPIKLGDSDKNIFEQNQLNGKNILIERGVGNNFTNNYLSANQYYDNRSNSSLKSTITLSQQSIFNIKVDSYSTVDLIDSEGKIFKPSNSNVATVVDKTGSLLSINKNIIGSSSSIKTLNFIIKTGEGSGKVKISPQVWQTSVDKIKQWTSTSDTIAQSYQYQVGDLTANTQYRVFKNNQLLMFATADSTGWIEFSDFADNLSAINYSVTP